MSHKQFISTKNPQKWPPIFVKPYYYVTPWVKPPAAFSAANPALSAICRFTGKVPQLWQGALRELETTRRCCYPAPHGVRWKHPEKTPGKKKVTGFLAGERSWRFCWGFLRQRKSGSAKTKSLFCSWNWNILKTSDSFCYKSSFSSAC